MSDQYDPVECLRSEVERFKRTNRFTPMEVTGLYLQAACVLDELRMLREDNVRLRDELERARLSAFRFISHVSISEEEIEALFDGGVLYKDRLGNLQPCVTAKLRWPNRSEKSPQITPSVP